MKTKLKNIANVLSGLYARTVPEGEIVFLQARHFDENGLIMNFIHPELMKNVSVERHLLKPGDVLFAAKGTRNFAAVFGIQNQPCVASTSFFVIRTQGSTIAPEYLAWYLNHIDTQRNLKNKAIGSSIVSISKPVLEELEIFVPDLKIQQTILEISRLRNQEKQLKKRIEMLREQQIQQVILKAIQ